MTSSQQENLGRPPEHINNSIPCTLSTKPLGSPQQQHPHSQPGSSSPTSLKSLKWYRQFSFSKTQFALLVILAVQSVAVISILSATVAKIQKEIQMSTPQLKTVSTYLAIFIVANVFSIVMAVDLLLNKNVIQLIALCLFNISMAIYGAVLPVQIKRALQTPGGAVSWNGARVGTSCNMYVSCYGVQYLYGDIQGWIIAIPVITGACSGVMGYLTWLIYKEFGWEIFKQIGADLTLKRILQRKYIFYMLQKFVFFFFVGFSLQFMMLSADVSTLERVLTIAAIPGSLAVIALGGVAIRSEVKWMMGVYVVVWSGAMIYFFYKLVRLYQNESISSAVKSLTIFSVLTIMLLFGTGLMAGLCYLQFGKVVLDSQGGLSDSVWLKLFRSQKAKTSLPEDQTIAKPVLDDDQILKEDQTKEVVVDDVLRQHLQHGVGIDIQAHARMGLIGRHQESNRFHHQPRMSLD